jgi:hypothetical protein
MKIGIYDITTGEQEIRDFTDEELAEWQQVAPSAQWEGLRVMRNIKIADTDWWATSDRTMTAEQIAYRQALRDLPANTTDPANPVWPTKP